MLCYLVCSSGSWEGWVIDMDNFEIPVFDAELVEDESGMEIMETGQTEMIALVLEQNEILTNIRDDIHPKIPT